MWPFGETFAPLAFTRPRRSLATVGVVRNARMASDSLEELGGVTVLLEDAGILEELAATLLEEATLLLDGVCALLEETGVCSSSLGTWPLKLS